MIKNHIDKLDLKRNNNNNSKDKQNKKTRQEPGNKEINKNNAYSVFSNQYVKCSYCITNEILGELGLK
jgi:hypothetical protein